jgi:2-deoxy-D-gluconate 3-dehydrogenase
LSENPFDLSGRVALVTGGNGGIGLAIALSFAQAGANVAIFARNEAKSRAALEQLKKYSPKALALNVDLADRALVQPAFEQVERELGSVSILVNNAGARAPGSILTVSEDDWGRVLQTNLTAPWLLCRLAAESMLSRKDGKIINMSSATIAFGNTVASAYAVSKAALTQLTRCLASELAPFNIQVNAIAPGYIDTDMVAGLKGTPAYEYGISRTPTGRWGKPEEVAGIALYLASAASSFTTGQVFFIDGGYTSKQ